MSAKFPGVRRSWFAYLDSIAIIAWGVLLLKYAIVGTLYILIHPSYYPLVTITGVCLLFIGIYRGWQIYRDRQPETADLQHSNLLPIGITQSLFLGAAILGLAIEPKVFNSHAAVQRGVSAAAVTITRTQTQAFRTNTKPEARSLVDWVRTLNNYPEPDAYLNQKVNINGFVFYPQELPNKYLKLSRFVITCCAADAYPVALIVKLPGDRQTYPQDSWLQIKGKAIVETLADSRQLVIEAASVTPIPVPKNPYQE